VPAAAMATIDGSAAGHSTSPPPLPAPATIDTSRSRAWATYVPRCVISSRVGSGLAKRQVDNPHSASLQAGGDPFRIRVEREVARSRRHHSDRDDLHEWPCAYGAPAVYWGSHCHGHLCSVLSGPGVSAVSSVERDAFYDVRSCLRVQVYAGVDQAYRCRSTWRWVHIRQELRVRYLRRRGWACRFGACRLGARAHASEREGRSDGRGSRPQLRARHLLRHANGGRPRRRRSDNCAGHR
jgi:hypothetical protein